MTAIAEILTDTNDADPSLRFLRPGNPVLAANLASLWAMDPFLAVRVEQVSDDTRYTVESAASGEPTMSIAHDGKRLYLHSRHRPRDEARRLLDSLSIDGQIVIYMFGLGLGYALQEQFERSGDETVFCVFEPDLALLRTTLAHRNLTDILDSRRFYIFCDQDKADLFTRLMPMTAMISLGTVDIPLAAAVRLNPRFHEQMQSWLAEFASFSRTNMNTLVLNGRRTLENIARNSGWFARTSDVSRFKDRYAGKPAIVVSAGPSLRKNRHLLKAAAEGAIIIAVQTTFQPLLEMGIEPDFVTALDYHDICTRFFEKIPSNVRTELVAEPKATNKIFSLHTGPVTIIGNDMAEGLLREMNLNKTGLPSGSTVAHLAYYLAEHLGCNPIGFVGQDLGFSDGLYYVPGTSYEDVWRPELSRFCTVEMKNWEQIVRERPIMRKIPDQLGRPMYTEERLFAYLQQFERDFLKTKTTIIDASEGGAAKRGTVQMPLREMLDTYCTEPIDRTIDDNDVRLAPPRRGGPLPLRGGDKQEDASPTAAASLLARKTEAAEIERISRETIVLLKELHANVDDQPRVNRLIARIDPLRKQMHARGRTYDLVVQLAQQSELARFRSDRKIKARKLTGLDLQREQVSRDVDNVAGVIQAAVNFQLLMDECIEHLHGEAA